MHPVVILQAPSGVKWLMCCLGLTANEMRFFSASTCDSASDIRAHHLSFQVELLTTPWWKRFFWLGSFLTLNTSKTHFHPYHHSWQAILRLVEHWWEATPWKRSHTKSDQQDRGLQWTKAPQSRNFPYHGCHGIHDLERRSAMKWRMIGKVTIYLIKNTVNNWLISRCLFIIFQREPEVNMLFCLRETLENHFFGTNFVSKKASSITKNGHEVCRLATRSQPVLLDYWIVLLDRPVRSPSSAPMIQNILHITNFSLLQPHSNMSKMKKWGMWLKPLFCTPNKDTHAEWYMGW